MGGGGWSFVLHAVVCLRVPLAPALELLIGDRRTGFELPAGVDYGAALAGLDFGKVVLEPFAVFSSTALILVVRGELFVCWQGFH